MTPEEAAFAIARMAWPNERISNLMSWYERLVTEPQMLAETHALAEQKLHEQGRTLAAAKQVLDDLS